MVIYCSVHGCRSTSNNDKETRFFRFPADDYRSKLWVRAVHRPDLANKTAQELYKSYYVCDRHFAQSCKKKRRLNKQAVPSLRLPGLEPLLLHELPEMYRETSCSSVYTQTDQTEMIESLDTQTGKFHLPVSIKIEKPDSPTAFETEETSLSPCFKVENPGSPVSNQIEVPSVTASNKRQILVSPTFAQIKEQTLLVPIKVENQDWPPPTDIKENYIIRPTQTDNLNYATFCKVVNPNASVSQIIKPNLIEASKKLNSSSFTQKKKRSSSGSSKADSSHSSFMCVTCKLQISFECNGETTGICTCECEQVSQSTQTTDDLILAAANLLIEARDYRVCRNDSTQTTEDLISLYRNHHRTHEPIRPRRTALRHPFMIANKPKRAKHFASTFMSTSDSLPAFGFINNRALFKKRKNRFDS